MGGHRDAWQLALIRGAVIAHCGVRRRETTVLCADPKPSRVLIRHAVPMTRLTLPHGDPTAVDLILAIRAGNLDALRRLLAERPELASAHMIGREGIEGGWRTPLHVATDWPGYFPQAPVVVALLAAEADPNDDSGGDRPETPLHWAASTDDVEVAAALIDGGAYLHISGGSIGTQLDNAIGYGCWHVARLLVERGAPVETLWQAAALGVLDRVDELLTARPSGDELNAAFWQACHGGQRRAAERLLVAGAGINASPGYADGRTALDAALQPDTRRDLLATWLRERDVTSKDQD